MSLLGLLYKDMLACILGYRFKRNNDYYDRIVDFFIVLVNLQPSTVDVLDRALLMVLFIIIRLV